MKRTSIIAGAAAVVGLAAASIVLRPADEPRPWQTTDVWYHESDVALLARTERPQLVEFFHPD